MLLRRASDTFRLTRSFHRTTHRTTLALGRRDFRQVASRSTAKTGGKPCSWIPMCSWGPLCERAWPPSCLGSFSRCASNGAVAHQCQVVREYLAVVARLQTWASLLPMPEALLDASRFAAYCRAGGVAARAASISAPARGPVELHLRLEAQCRREAALVGCLQHDLRRALAAGSPRTIRAVATSSDEDALTADAATVPFCCHIRWYPRTH